MPATSYPTGCAGGCGSGWCGNPVGLPPANLEALNSIVWFRDHFGDNYPVKRSDFRPVCKGADIGDRLNDINGEPYPKKKRTNGKGKKKSE